ncbi:MAG: hypothetical protein EA353_02865 [Puniceicoccaceae bacterium]|nr:MAG: hypothetical protein EA353_02865 [Puniceicoccaceae bacterium]
MKKRASTFFYLLLAGLFAVPVVETQARSPLDTVGRRAGGLEQQRFEKRSWQGSQSSSIMDKRFPLQQWDKHFSSVGSKRAPISMSEGRDKAIFQTKTLPRKETTLEMSRLNQRMSDLHKRAGIEMSDQAQVVIDQQNYASILRDPVQFKDMAEKLSLRDVNRYQFRRNRPDGDMPVQRAGGGQ